MQFNSRSAHDKQSFSSSVQIIIVIYEFVYDNHWSYLTILSLSNASQPTNYSNPVYAKLFVDGHNCRNSLISVEERRELLPKKIENAIRETVA